MVICVTMSYNNEKEVSHGCNFYYDHPHGG